MITVCIADSNYAYRNLLKEYCKKMEMKVVRLASCAEDVINCFITDEVELLITDVYLEDSCGIELCMKLSAMGYNPWIILSTSSMKTEHFLQAINLRVLSYLIKPYDFQQLNNAVLKIQTYRMEHSHIGFTQCKVKKKNSYLESDKIVYIEKVANKKCQLHLLDGKVIETSTTLKEFRDQLPTFIMPHRSYLVNKKTIGCILPSLYSIDGYEIHLNALKETIPLTGRRYREWLRKNT